jgi:tRNA nucleotidyltransferase/poly(A) polymerase
LTFNPLCGFAIVKLLIAKLLNALFDIQQFFSTVPYQIFAERQLATIVFIAKQRLKFSSKLQPNFSLLSLSLFHNFITRAQNRKKAFMSRTEVSNYQRKLLNGNDTLQSANS